ncbi:hypothetical protein [Pseudohongiella sp.]|uniref:SIR2-like domain-containing protein n=1 Tax=marine sediment metagenome TaxID=412755 RepID=A0A0F9Z4K9_9ZZZZ|nr:hypothetical protein [Pseudohongiella sp.]HDZ07741.1 hypothetical protein [Pseudohongiella sp.]HEA62942.1 hypothetical protein [Pseudohongiella sp.]
MFNKETTIILGAGASCGYGYPLGHDLIDKMISVASIWGASDYDDAAVHGRRIKEMLTFYDPVSIDSFLYHYEHDPELVAWSKICIGQVLLSCANLSRFNRGGSESQNWYRLLWNAVVGTTNVEKLVDPDYHLNMRIITFNYDASLEAFFFSRVNQQNSIFRTAEEKRLFLQKLTESIFHVYGCIMDYQWQGGEDSNHLYEFREPSDRNQYAYRCREKIMLINERQVATYDLIQAWIKEAEQVIFLGFGFDDLNIGPKVLDLQKTLGRRKDGSIEPWAPLIKYTNFNDSEIINRKVDILTRHNQGKRGSGLLKSTKDVYRALSEDFSLNSPH